MSNRDAILNMMAQFFRREPVNDEVVFDPN
jgi:hypothetical protein